MGTQIGAEYALGGHTVTLWSRDQDALRERVREVMDIAARFDLAQPAELNAAVQRIRLVANTAEIELADLFVESLPEDKQLKIALLRPMALRYPEATLASNTSSLGVGDLGEAIGAPERTIGTHYWNPPLLMPLVELVGTQKTEPERLKRMTSVLEKLGKRPINVRDVPGFVWNRLQFALLREALWVVEQGVASAEDVDEIVRSGLARRLRLTGPFQTVALGGAATFEAVAANLFPRLSNADAAPNLARFGLSETVNAPQLRADRDQGLAADLHAD